MVADAEVALGGVKSEHSQQIPASYLIQLTSYLRRHQFVSGWLHQETIKRSACFWVQGGAVLPIWRKLILIVELILVFLQKLLAALVLLRMTALVMV